MLRDAAGAALRDGGELRTGPVFRIDVMRKAAGFGEAYGASRSGEWEYVSYAPDGSALTPAESLGELRRLPPKCRGGARLRFQGSFLDGGTID